jgi:hypothetical protein
LDSETAKLPKAAPVVVGRRTSENPPARLLLPGGVRRAFPTRRAAGSPAGSSATRRKGRPESLCRAHPVTLTGNALCAEVACPRAFERIGHSENAPLASCRSVTRVSPAHGKLQQNSQTVDIQSGAKRTTCMRVTRYAVWRRWEALTSVLPGLRGRQIAVNIAAALLHGYPDDLAAGVDGTCGD